MHRGPLPQQRPTPVGSHGTAAPSAVPANSSGAAVALVTAASCITAAAAFAASRAPDFRQRPGAAACMAGGAIGSVRGEAAAATPLPISSASARTLRAASARASATARGLAFAGTDRLIKDGQQELACRLGIAEAACSLAALPPAQHAPKGGRVMRGQPRAGCVEAHQHARVRPGASSAPMPRGLPRGPRDGERSGGRAPGEATHCRRRMAATTPTRCGMHRRAPRWGAEPRETDSEERNRWLASRYPTARLPPPAPTCCPRASSTL
jgi:hypothetical protein